MSNLKAPIAALNKRIAIIRKHKQLTQNEFSLCIQVSRGYISEVENGKKKPSIEILTGINSSFRDINPDWLLSGKGLMYLEEEKGTNQSPEWFTDWWEHADDEHRTWLKIQLKQTPPITT